MPSLGSILLAACALVPLVHGQDLEVEGKKWTAVGWTCVSSCLDNNRALFVKATADGKIQCAGASNQSCRWFQNTDCSIPGKGTVPPPADFTTGYTCKKYGGWCGIARAQLEPQFTAPSCPTGTVGRTTKSPQKTEHSETKSAPVKTKVETETKSATQKPKSTEAHSEASQGASRTQVKTETKSEKPKTTKAPKPKTTKTAKVTANEHAQDLNIEAVKHTGSHSGTRTWSQHVEETHLIHETRPAAEPTYAPKPHSEDAQEAETQDIEDVQDVQDESVEEVDTPVTGRRLRRFKRF